MLRLNHQTYEYQCGSREPEWIMVIRRHFNLLVMDDHSLSCNSYGVLRSRPSRAQGRIASRQASPASPLSTAQHKEKTEWLAFRCTVATQHGEAAITAAAARKRVPKPKPAPSSPSIIPPSTLLANVILGFGETFPSSTGRMLLASSCLIIR
jgi:hypothetical protein